MTHEDVKAIESKLKEKKYKRITQCKAEEHDDYEWYKAFYDYSKDEYPLKYQIFFCFWDFSKYEHYDKTFCWSVSIIIMPESCENDVGRRDLNMSVNWSDNIEKVETCAEEFYEFITKIDKL